MHRLNALLLNYDKINQLEQVMYGDSYQMLSLFLIDKLKFLNKQRNQQKLAKFQVQPFTLANIPSMPTLHLCQPSI